MLIDLLLAQPDIDVNLRDIDGRTALMPAARAGHLKVVKRLLEAGTDPNAKNRRGVSAHGEVLEELDKLTQVIESIRQASSNPVSPPTADGDELPARR